MQWDQLERGKGGMGLERGICAATGTHVMHIYAVSKLFVQIFNK